MQKKKFLDKKYLSLYVIDLQMFIIEKRTVFFLSKKLKDLVKMPLDFLIFARAVSGASHPGQRKKDRCPAACRPALHKPKVLFLPK